MRGQEAHGFNVTTHSPNRIAVGIRVWRWLKGTCPWLLLLCSGPVWLWTTIRREVYRRRWKSTRKLSQPVVSVGNVTIGGTGKTPFVIWLAHRFQEAGRKVAILSRGYGRRLPSEYVIVSDGKQMQVSWQLSGDEPYLIAQQCPGAIVAVGSNRYELGQWVNARFECDCFILDDGFQHLQLHRDLNFVLLDARDQKGLDGIFPAGHLREPLRSLMDATAIVLTRANSSDVAKPVLTQVNHAVGLGYEPIYVNFLLSSCWHLASGMHESVDRFRNQRALVFSGIGNPQAFFDDVKAAGIDLVEEIQFADHFPYSARDMEEIRKVMKEQSIQVAFTTEKDAVKIAEWVRAEDPIWVMSVELKISQGADMLLQLMHGLPWKIKRETSRA